ncbi:hypothetical protein NM208_g3436 [Fusarium decemcellulare]|uniref:Uncharacterized protein n=1 Tax=Fusarium decemcellulare TaxID=57161 RepID=A0ACC1SPE4_9HYPO|nr:hypothetical protein NM208_g3436 [Fusarium decemcellulare]
MEPLLDTPTSTASSPTSINTTFSASTHTSASSATTVAPELLEAPCRGITPHLAVFCGSPPPPDAQRKKQPLAFLISVRVGREEDHEQPGETLRAPCNRNLEGPIHVPVNVVLMLALSSSGPGHQLKADLVRDSVRHLKRQLKNGDRLGVLAFSHDLTWRFFESSLDQNDDPLLEALATTPGSYGRQKIDLVQGIDAGISALLNTNVKAICPALMLVSDSAAMDRNGLGTVAGRADRHNLAIHTFGLGLAHSPDALIELSTRTKATYTYVKDWMVLPERLLSSMQLVRGQLLPNVQLRLRVLNASRAVFTGVEGAPLVTGRLFGNEKIVSLGNLGLHDERDVLVSMEMGPEANTPCEDRLPRGRNFSLPDSSRARQGPSGGGYQDRGYHDVDLDLFQVDMTWADIEYPSTVVRPPEPVVVRLVECPGQNLHPPGMLHHFNMVQRQAELFTAGLLSQALALSSAGHVSKAQLMLANAYGAIQQLLGSDSAKTHGLTHNEEGQPRSTVQAYDTIVWNGWFGGQREPLRFACSTHDRAELLSKGFVIALLAEIQACSEWIAYPDIFCLDGRKRALEVIGVLSFQRRLDLSGYHGSKTTS